MGYDLNDPNQDSQQQPSPYRYGWQGTQAGQALANQFRSNWKTYTGQDANDDIIWNQYLNWDRMPDSTFAAKLSSQMANSDEAKAYRASQQQQQTPPPATAPTPKPTTQTQSATGSPVTATGQIPPAQAATPAPAAPAARNLQGMDLSSVPAYKPTNFSDPSGTRNSQSALLSSILQNPQTMNASTVDQLKEQQKEQALQIAQQNQAQLDNAGIARGTLGGNLAAQRANLDAMMSAILTGNRDVDIKAAAQNRADELAALNAAHAQDASFLGLDQATANDQRYALQDALDRQLKQFGINQSVAQQAGNNYAQDISTWLAQNNLGLDYLKFGENQRQFNNTLGFNYNQLDANTQAAILAAILGRSA